MPDLSDPASVWQAVLGRLQLEMPKEHFNTFLRPCVGQSWDPPTAGGPVSGTGPALVVAAASSFAVSWLELPLHLTMAREALAGILGREAAIRYEAMPTVAQGDAADSGRAAVHAVSAPPASSRRQRAPVPDDYDLGRGSGDGYDWAAVNSATCDPRYSFDNFIVGDSNELAYQAARATVSVKNRDNRGSAPAGYNPLLLYAGSGLGKTHLLHAIGNAALQQGRSILYVTSEQFTNEFVSSINRRAMREFRDRYRGVDLLLLDDVQFLAGKEQTQESLFHTFNDIHQAGSQIVITSDRPPQTILSLEDRLRSRLLWGLVADISPPSLETRLAMLHAWADDRGTAVPETVVDLIAQRVSHNVRQLQGAFNRVVAMAQLMNTPLTPETVSQQLDAIAGPDARAEITPEQMLKAVARHYRIAEEQILGRGRTATVAEARQIAMYLMSEEMGMTPTDTGRALGGRNHSTVIHGVGKIRDAIATDDRLRHAVNTIKTALFA
ncbi:MAG: chromosomal replication initiator protein DnaA [Dehalococcoidia bacterium]|nr:chromosomal replication initiator protein DnaA [Dehalococcoidia bacterium]